MPVLVTVCRARARNEVGVFLSSVSMCVLMACIEVQIHNTVCSKWVELESEESQFRVLSICDNCFCQLSCHNIASSLCVFNVLCSVYTLTVCNWCLYPLVCTHIY